MGSSGGEQDTPHVVRERCRFVRQGEVEPARGGFTLGEGDGNRVSGSVAVGIVGIQRAAGFVWPEPDEGVASAWGFEDNIAHNNWRNGIFVWQNGPESHVVERFVAYRNGGIGIDHGAYGNRYLYRDIQLVGNRECGVQNFASSHVNQVQGLTFENVEVDGEGVTIVGFKVFEHSPNATLYGPTLVKNIVIKNLDEAKGQVVAYRYDGAATGQDPPGGGAAKREWFRFLNADFQAAESDHFRLQGNLEGGTTGQLPESDIYVEATNGAVYTVRSPLFSTSFGDSFDASLTDWPWYWVRQHAAGELDSVRALQSGRAVVTAAAGQSSRELYYLKTRQAGAVTQSATVRVSNADSLAGAIAARQDGDRESYYAVTVGTNQPLSLVKVTDGVVTTVLAGSAYLTANQDARLTFKVQPATGGGTELFARLGNLTTSKQYFEQRLT